MRKRIPFAQAVQGQGRKTHVPKDNASISRDMREIEVINALEGIARFLQGQAPRTEAINALSVLRSAMHAAACIRLAIDTEATDVASVTEGILQGEIECPETIAYFHGEVRLLVEMARAVRHVSMESKAKGCALGLP